MLKVNNVMLNQTIVDHIVDVELESPRHWHLSFTGEIDEMSHYFVRI
jgi:hypothetical protein